MKGDIFAEKIRRAGFRATKQRVLFVSILAKAKLPLLTQDIVDRIGPEGVDQVTVYRMVDAFKKAGIVREVNLRGDNPRYELEDEHDHHHIVCTDCGRVEDFTEHTHERVEKHVLAKSKKFKKITGHAFDLYGLCNTCAK
jgi:Fur family ferric uptake transcriptional regulator